MYVVKQLTIFYRLSSPNGKKKALSAKNCKEAKEALLAYCTKPPESGVYWAQNIQVTSFLCF